MSRRLKIRVEDNTVHRRLSGYGATSRFMMLGLLDAGHEISLPQRDAAWEELAPVELERLQALAQDVHARDADVVLEIGLPSRRRQSKKPSVLYTMNALGGLRPDWLEALRQWDGVIVPSRFDQAVFARDLPRVYAVPLGSDRTVFKPVPGWRSEGSEAFTFLYVGSYSYRKGVDLLLEAFLREFTADEPVELPLHAAGAGTGTEFRHCLSLIQRQTRWATWTSAAGAWVGRG